MCGIFGFTNFTEEGLLERMSRSIIHRGPDGEGSFCDGNFSMGMRRLSIIDLEGGDQPIYNEENTLVVCYNGEIYNYVELREELEARGHHFRTHSDTEVIVHAYEEYGEKCLDHFNGMFAFCLYDKRDQSLFLARDRAGQKPLYYYHRGGKFLFASEIKAILESAHVSRECNVSALDSFLSLRYVPQPDTLFADIHILPGGHFMRWKKGEIHIERYWDVPINLEGNYQSEAHYLEALEETFLDAVRLTMRSDVPVGAYLSGGVDSSLVVAAMRRMTDKLNTFSIGFNSPIDETHQARALASELGTTHHEVNISPGDFSLLPKVLWHLERPIGDVLILAYYKLAEEARKEVKVVLSGEGADENFAGYSFHKIIQWTQWYRRIVPRWLNRGIVAPVLDAIPVWLLDKFFIYPAYLGESGKAKTVDYLRNYHDTSLAGNYVALKALWDTQERQSIFTAETRERQNRQWLHPSRDSRGPFLDRLLKLQFDDWLQDNLLLRQDKNTMAHSLEMRVPFLDHRLIELAFRMPPNLKVHALTDKYIERQLAKKFLPPVNVKRSKNPFYFPLEFFHQNPIVQELIDSSLDPAQVKKRGYFKPEAVSQLRARMETGEFLYLKQVLSLVILELWHKIFIDREGL